MTHKLLPAEPTTDYVQVRRDDAEHWLRVRVSFDNGVDLDNHYMIRARLRTAIAVHDAHPSPRPDGLDVDALAQEIRRVDGNHKLGAGALAEALMPFLKSWLGLG